MRILLFSILLFLSVGKLLAQPQQDPISTSEIDSLMHYLASDEMAGRTNYSPEQRTAAVFIANYYDSMGLKPFIDSNAFLVAFDLNRIGLMNLRGIQDGDLYNVMACIPGKSKPGEMVLFTAHYDHVKTDINGKKGLFNGANDNASGTVGLMMLAKYYALRNDNERTLVFCSFAAEEMGLGGSRVMAELMKTDSIIACINLEMIGIPQFGKNRFFITGAFYSDFARIFRKSIRGSNVKLISEPPEDRMLFRRSDNFPFAMKGVPAHTIMSSDDEEKCYHQTCDDAHRIDAEHMKAVIEAVIRGCSTIVSGEATPRRIVL